MEHYVLPSVRSPEFKTLGIISPTEAGQNQGCTPDWIPWKVPQKMSCWIDFQGGVVPLHVAGRHGQYNVLSALIAAGADLSVATADGLTALHCAARNGHHDCVELLVVRGADLTAKTKVSICFSSNY